MLKNKSFNAWTEAKDFRHQWKNDITDARVYVTGTVRGLWLIMNQSGLKSAYLNPEVGA